MRAKMKKLIQKAVTFMITAALALGAAPLNTVKAADGQKVTASTTGKITVTNVGQTEGVYDTINCYQIIKIEYTEADNSLKYEWASEKIAGIVKVAVRNTESDDYTVEKYMAAMGDDAGANNAIAQTVYEALVKAAYLGNLEVYRSETTTTGTVVFENMPMGQYLLIAEGENVYRPMTGTLQPVVEAVDGKDCYILYDDEFEAKNQPASVDKGIVKGDELLGEDTVEIGEEVTFKLTLTVPNFPENAVSKQVILTDIFEGDLKDIKDLNGKADSVTVKAAVTSGASYEEVDEDAYTFAYIKDKGKIIGFKMEFDVEDETLKGKTSITVEYKATATAAIRPGDDGENSVKLEWPKNIWIDRPEYNEDTDKVELETFGIKVIKVDQKDKTPLSGVEFELYTDEKCTNAMKFIKDNGIYILDETGSATLVTDAKGELRVDGLSDETYYLKETKAPTGYVLPDKSTTITVDKESKPANGIFVFQIENSKGFGLLPQTGDMGTMLFTVSGIMVMCSAIVLLVVLSRRKRSAN